jgi:hypothetical protein
MAPSAVSRDMAFNQVMLHDDLCICDHKWPGWCPHRGDWEPTLADDLTQVFVFTSVHYQSVDIPEENGPL